MSPFEMSIHSVHVACSKCGKKGREQKFHSSTLCIYKRLLSLPTLSVLHPARAG